MNYESSTLGEIATQIPGATQIFRKYKLDFCCNGNRTLEVALKNSDLKSKTVIDDIIKIVPTIREGNASDLNSKDLIELIVGTYHEKHRRDIPELITMAERVEVVHGEKSDCPVGLAAHLRLMGQEMEDHMSKEEKDLFPAIENQSEDMIQLIETIEAEHQEHGKNLEILEQITSDHHIPEGACNTWRALLLGTKTLAEDLTEHIHLENNILFPQAIEIKSLVGGSK